MIFLTGVSENYLLFVNPHAHLHTHFRYVHIMLDIVYHCLHCQFLLGLDDDQLSTITTRSFPNLLEMGGFPRLAD